jgi:hypothetical protein
MYLFVNNISNNKQILNEVFSVVCNVLPVVVSSEQLVINIEDKPDKNPVKKLRSCNIYSLQSGNEQLYHWIT